MKYPELYLIRQVNPAPAPVLHVRETIFKKLRKFHVDQERIKGKRIGITAGSRGIDRIPEVMRAVVDYVKMQGGTPVVFAAMGSHGNGTAAGQREMLASLGIIEGTMEAEVLCCDTCRLLGKSRLGYEVYCNELADTFDGLILLNRVKTHTDFSDVTESGLLKMLAIGIGNPQGCKGVHNRALRIGYGTAIRDTAELMLEKLPVLFGIMVTENWKGELDSIRAAYPDQILEEEKEALRYVKDHQVKLPVDAADVLLVGEIGKNISGSGMDTKVIGRIRVLGQKEPEKPEISRIAVFGLTEASHGNAIGIGLADYTTESVFRQIDMPAMTLNAVSSNAPEQGSIPPVLPTQRDAVEAAILTAGIAPEQAGAARLLYIKNTEHLEMLAVSEALYRELEKDPCIECLRGPDPMRFSENGDLLTYREDFWPADTIKC